MPNRKEIKCAICGRKCKGTRGLAFHLRSHSVSNEEYYLTYICPDSNRCVICGQPTKFNKLSKGFYKTCCKECRIKSFKMEYNKTCMERYGVNSPMKLDIFKEKVKNTMIKNYGVDNIAKSKKIQNIKKENHLKKYGVEAPAQRDSIKAKMAATNIERYGVAFASKTDKVKEKVKQTNLDRYGVCAPLQSSSVLDKMKKTCLKRYGVENPGQLRKTIDVNKELMLDKIISGVRLQYCSMLDISSYISTNKDNKYKFKCNYCDNIFFSHLENGHQPKCPICFNGSLIEQYISEILSMFNIKYITNDRSIISPYELDFYLPDYNIAIECNGIYWHAENQLANRKLLPCSIRNYHLFKYNMCKKNGIKLLQFFEDEILDKKVIVESMILNRLGLSEKLCGARQCNIVDISAKIANKFLNDNHIHGRNYGSTDSMGAIYKGNLVSVMSFKKGNISRKSTQMELDRFCTKTHYYIPGISSKMFSRFLKTRQVFGNILTYSDLRFGVGSVYKYLGFNFISQSLPNYFYVIGTKRKHRFSYRKSVLKNKLRTFDPTLTEYQNMLSNGYDRVWDCGHFKFLYGK